MCYSPWGCKESDTTERVKRLILLSYQGFPRSSVVGIHLQWSSYGFVEHISLSWEDLLEKEMATHFSIVAWKSHGQRNLGGG